MKSIKLFYSSHKKATIIGLILLIGGGYYFYQSKSSGSVITTYTLGTVEKGTIISSVSATGQLSNVTQVDLSPKISTAVTAVYVTEGQAVKAGDVLVQLDNKDLLIAVQQAKNSLDNAQNSYDAKVVGLTTEEMTVQENSVKSAQSAYDNAVKALQTAKDDAAENTRQSQQDLDNYYNTVKITLSSALVSMHSSLTAADNVLGIDNPSLNSTLENLLGSSDPQSVIDATNYYNSAKEGIASYEAAYNNASASWTPQNEEDLLNKALPIFQNLRLLHHSIYAALMSAVSTADLAQSTIDSSKSSAASQESSAISNVNTIQSAIQSIANYKDDITQTATSNKKSLDSAESDLNSKTISLENAKAQYATAVAPPKETDLASARIQVAQAKISYEQALQNLENAQIIAPIDGVVAAVDAVIGLHGSDAAANPTAVTIVTPEQLAEVTLNEVDAAKVKAGQKVTLTFNAIDGLTLTGKVVSVDEIGSVSQGVVSYGVKIALDSQDDRVKSEMSVTADIITNESIDALMVPASAIKTDSDGNSYVQIFPEAANLTTNTDGSVVSDVMPESKTVIVGISDDTNTEIKLGLSEGDKIIVKTNTSTAGGSAASSKTSSSQSSNSALRMLSGGGGPR